MLRRSVLFCSFSLLLLAASSGFARNILEKKIQYINNNGKVGQARFWVVFLGNFDVKLTKKFPGEPEQQVDASVNFQIISSGYIEGNGYSAKGKIDHKPPMIISNANGERKIDLDSIDFIYDYGAKVALVNGETGDFFMDVDGTKLAAKKFLMREYALTNYYGEEILKEGSTEIPLAAFALTKEGIARAQKAQAKLEAK
ncbi:MAG TPA: hypothetical protein VHO70_24165 [Chitinispirillaceae bacterium]|nr:hypothetical protein [Chitinispirillaceae bacterium]